MAKVNVKMTDPVRYAQVVAEQQELKRVHSSSARLARLCPFCSHKIEVLCRGAHGGTYSKCQNCGEDVFFPPVTFRRA